MLQLTYISTAREIGEDGIDAILRVSRRNNQRDGITGLLLFNGRRFLQALEGPADLVTASYGRITADPRHRAAVILASKEVATPQFGKWEMAFERIAAGRIGASASPSALPEIVDDLVAGVTDPNIRALFSSYARLKAA